jgi:hypothetical protein
LTETIYEPPTELWQVRVELGWVPLRSMLVGLREQTIFGLSVLFVSVTVPVRPATGFTVIVEVPELPDMNGGTELGVAVIEKSRPVLTLTPIFGLVNLLLPPEIAVTLTWPTGLGVERE